MTEAELVQIYREHFGRLYTYVSRRVAGDRGLAEDIVQETWLRAVATWPTRGKPENAPAWLIKVARNQLASFFRRIRPVPVDPAELDLADNSVAPETTSAATLVHWGMSRIKHQQALLIEAFHFEGKSIRDIAKDFGLSERAVEGRLRRARQNLRNHLAPYVRNEIPKDIGMNPAKPEESVAQPSDGEMENAPQT